MRYNNKTQTENGDYNQENAVFGAVAYGGSLTLSISNCRIAVQYA